MNKKLIFGILTAFALVVSVTATGCKHDADSDGGKPGKLSATAGYYETLYRLEEIINYCNRNNNSSNVSIRANAQTLMTKIEAETKSTWITNGVTYISQINGIIDLLQGGGGSGQGGGGASTSLIGTWISDSTGATVTITANSFTATASGATALTGTVSGNTLTVTGGPFSDQVTGSGYASVSASGNTLTVSGFSGTYASYINGTYTRSGSNSGPSGGGTVDSNLVGEWYVTQASTSDGTPYLFKITSGGKLTLNPDVSIVEFTVTTSNGKITTTGVGLTQTADYEYSNKTVKFSNVQPYNGMPFTQLEAGQELSQQMGGGGKFYKK